MDSGGCYVQSVEIWKADELELAYVSSLLIAFGTSVVFWSP